MLKVILSTVLGAFLGKAAGGGFKWTHKLNKKGAKDDNGNDLGGIMPFSLTMLPEIGIAIGAGLALSPLYGWWAALAAIWVYVAIQIGHGNFFKMQGRENPDRLQTLERIVLPAYEKLGLDPAKKHYSWVCMALKGLLIGLPLLPTGLTPVVAVAFPIAYWLSFKFKGDSGPAEYMFYGIFGGLLGLAG